MTQDKKQLDPDLVSAIVSAAMAGADVFIDANAQVVLILTPKGRETANAIGAEDQVSMAADGVIGFLKQAVARGLSVIGRDPEGGLARLIDKPADMVEVERPPQSMLN